MVIQFSRKSFCRTFSAMTQGNKKPLKPLDVGLRPFDNFVLKSFKCHEVQDEFEFTESSFENECNLGNKGRARN